MLRKYNLTGLYHEHSFTFYLLVLKKCTFWATWLFLLYKLTFLTHKCLAGLVIWEKEYPKTHLKIFLNSRRLNKEYYQLWYYLTSNNTVSTFRKHFLCYSMHILMLGLLQMISLCFRILQFHIVWLILKRRLVIKSMTIFLETTCFNFQI